MGRPALEVADIFRAHGPAWRQAQHGHLSLGQLKVMSAIEQCRSAALGGHVLRCDACAQVQIAYNSCRNRHCPKCQARAARRWLEARQADLLPVDYYHLVFTLPAPISAIAYYNKAVIYDLLFAVAARDAAHHRRRPEASRRADRRDPGPAYLGLGAHASSACARHRAGGGLAPDGERWVNCKPGFFLPVRVLSRLFRRRFLEELGHGASRRPAAVLRGVRRAHRRAGVRPMARAAARVRMGRLRQTPLCRTGRGARLSVALHPSGGDLEPATAGPRRTRRHLPLEGLPRHGQDALQDHDARLPTSSSAASCCTFCLAAFTAFATTGCSPMPDAASISPARANCCTSSSPRPNRIRLRPPPPTSRLPSS